MTLRDAAHVPMNAGAEFDIIRTLQERWGALAVGLGDDAAVITPARGDDVVASTDASVEGVHFRRGWLTSREIGYRAVTAALSDLAAMAAQPIGVLISLTLPQGETDLDALADGIGDAVRAAGTVIRGGNLSRGQQLSITTTVLGSAMTPLRRDAARPGNHLYVTGSLGGPAAALRALLDGGAPAAAHRERFARPVARLAEARWLASRGAVAAIDISDGLLSDLGHLAAASGASIEISLETVPRLAQVTDQDVLGGEEYELLVSAAVPLAAQEFERRFGIPLTQIGEVKKGRPGVRASGGGQERIVTLPGYDHFSA